MAKKKTEIIEPIDITPEDSVVPVFLVPPTAEEEAEREQWAAESAERQATATAARESAITKLEQLGLTAEEIKAAFNIT